jgi:site-specific DNA-adenine methylase
VVGINEDYHSYGVLYKSDDLGETWTVINTKAEKGINSICLAPGYKYMPLRNLEKVKAASERLKQVIFEKQDFEKIIARFDTPHTFFYLDPPYYTKEHLYDREDSRAQ